MNARRQDQELIEMDIRGQICPSCLLLALKEVNTRAQELRDGSLELRILTDNRQATATIPEAVTNMGFDVDVVKEGGYYAVRVRGAR
jgi:TusA-related sulfurtransferase